MYTSEFRDKVYEDQHGTPPWTSFEHKQNTVTLLREYLPQDVSWKHILDYWCWDGQIWEYFLKMWADVDFAEISEKMVESLRRKYLYESELSEVIWDEKEKLSKAFVYRVESPSDLPEWEKYDYIISWCLFHHIDPRMRRSFLDSLCSLLKKWWRLFIGWCDKSDPILQQDWNLWHVTWKASWYIDSLPEYLDFDLYEVEDTWILDDKIPLFDVPRRLRYFVIVRK